MGRPTTSAAWFNPNLTRREALKMLGAGAVSLSVGGCDVFGDGAENGAEPLDVAVVGGGVGGLYAAWSLRTRVDGGRVGFRRSPPRVAVFEGTDRLGGRLYSVIPPGAPSLRAEMGAMRVLERQRLVTDLIEHLRLPTSSFPFGGPDNLLYLRGTRFTIGQILAAEPIVPYRLRGWERHRSPGELLVAAIERYVPEAGEMSAGEWTEAKKKLEVNGRRLIDQSLGSLLRAALSPDGFDLLDHGDGYESLEERHNAADLMQGLSADFKDPVYYKLDDGMSAISDELAARLLEAGGAVQTRTRLRKLERTSEAGEERIRLLFDSGGETRTVTARHVVLALPKRSIELLDAASFLFASPGFRDDLAAVNRIPASKLLFAYAEPWWRRLGVRSGRSLTDLPLRQCIYFPTERLVDGGEAGNRNSLLTATYNDAQAVEYFAQLADDGAPFESEGEVPSGLEVSDAMVLDAGAQLARVHGVEAPSPYWAAFKDWGRDPVGAGWHFWRVGERSWEVMPRMRRPVADANLYVCGEAWSAEQGWIEGALQTSEHVLHDHFGLRRPDWLRPGADLGP